MHRRTFRLPPTWDEETLELHRRQSIEFLVGERSREGNAAYQRAYANSINLVQQLFQLTDDLLQFGSGAALAANPALVQAARYLGGPPVSADDMDTLADARIASRRRLDADLARRAARIVEAALDRERFPCLFETPIRRPTATEREIAIRWTAGLQAVQQVQTGRRSELAARQETAVEQLLTDLGFRKVTRRPIDVTGGLAPSEYCRESLVVGTKCDIPIGLRDGRFLLVECKVSNSAINSVKRLNREVGGKASAWRSALGDRAITAAVLSGVFKLKNLLDAQASGVTIFWEHDLSPLADFLRRAVTR